VVLAVAVVGCSGSSGYHYTGGGDMGGRPGECGNGVKDGTETDVDCGGDCAPCATGKRCATGTDCQSGSCLNQVCVALGAGCSDGVKDGSETDVDCGGSCAPCASGLACLRATDCASRLCLNNVCEPPPSTCADGVRDGTETDVDCGGPMCAACDNGRRCLVAADCFSNFCFAGLCYAPPDGGPLRDGFPDSGEAGRDGFDSGGPFDLGGGGPIDLGGGGGDGGGGGIDFGSGDGGSSCTTDADCTGGVCFAGTCISQAQACGDGVQDGQETDVDCAGD
jgi:hypothetical protein